MLKTRVQLQLVQVNNQGGGGRLIRKGARFEHCCRHSQDSVQNNAGTVVDNHQSCAVAAFWWRPELPQGGTGWHLTAIVLYGNSLEAAVAQLTQLTPDGWSERGRGGPGAPRGRFQAPQGVAHAICSILVSDRECNLIDVFGSFFVEYF